MLEWLFTCPALGIALDSWPLVSVSVGRLAAVSWLLPVDDEDEDDVPDALLDEESCVAVADDDVVPLGALDDDDVVPVGALDVASVGCPAPVGLFGVAGSGGATDDEELVDGVTGGVAVVLVLVDVRSLHAVANTAAVAMASARAMGFMGSP